VSSSRISCVIPPKTNEDFGEDYAMGYCHYLRRGLEFVVHPANDLADLHHLGGRVEVLGVPQTHKEHVYKGVLPAEILARGHLHGNRSAQVFPLEPDQLETGIVPREQHIPGDLLESHRRGVLADPLRTLLPDNVRHHDRRLLGALQKVRFAEVPIPEPLELPQIELGHQVLPGIVQVDQLGNGLSPLIVRRTLAIPVVKFAAERLRIPGKVPTSRFPSGSARISGMGMGMGGM